MQDLGIRYGIFLMIMIHVIDMIQGMVLHHAALTEILMRKKILQNLLPHTSILLKHSPKHLLEITLTMTLAEDIVILVFKILRVVSIFKPYWLLLRGNYD